MKIYIITKCVKTQKYIHIQYILCYLGYTTFRPEDHLKCVVPGKCELSKRSSQNLTDFSGQLNSNLVISVSMLTI